MRRGLIGMMSVRQMGLVSLLVVLSVGLAGAEELQPQWAEVFQGKDGTRYEVDSASVTRDGDLTYFWFRYNLNPLLMGEVLSETRMYEAIDCRNDLEMQIKASTYTRDGQLAGSGENSNPVFKPIEAGSAQQAMQRYVCP